MPILPTIVEHFIGIEKWRRLMLRRNFKRQAESNFSVWSPLAKLRWPLTCRFVINFPTSNLQTRNLAFANRKTRKFEFQNSKLLVSKLQILSFKNWNYKFKNSKVSKREILNSKFRVGKLQFASTKFRVSKLKISTSLTRNFEFVNSKKEK